MQITKMTNKPVALIDFVLLENIKQIIRNTNNEIALKLIVIRENNLYSINGYFMPKQKVSFATCEVIAKKEMKQLFDENIDIDNLMGMFHSHVDMSPTPSGTDDRSFEEMYLQAHSFYLEMIMNKDGEYFIRIADMEEGLLYSDVYLNVVKNIPGIMTDEEAKTLIKKNVITETPNYMLGSSTMGKCALNAKYLHTRYNLQGDE